jgi:hypothetical protein
MATMLQAMAYYMPIYFISSYVQRLGMTPQTGANLIATNNGLSAIGEDTKSAICYHIVRLLTSVICYRQGRAWLDS